MDWLAVMRPHMWNCRRIVGTIAANGHWRSSAGRFDRFASDLTASGFALNERGESYRCTGNDALGYERRRPSCRPRLRASPEC